MALLALGVWRPGALGTFVASYLVVGDGEGHHFVVGMPGQAEDPDVGRVVPGRGQPVSHCVLQGFIDQQLHAV